MAFARSVSSFFQRISSSLKSEKKGTLFVFDFDETILVKSCNDVISSILAEEDIIIPMSIRIAFRQTKDWEAYLQGILNHIILEEQVPVRKMMDQVKRLKLLPGMEDLLKRVSFTVGMNKEDRFIIISGCNDLFIRAVLKNLNTPIIPCEIITNKLEIVEGEQGQFLLAQAYENQTDCQYCPNQLCKGRALLKYMGKEGPFKRVYYAGDGGNDLCPALKMSKKDTLFVRTGHRLHQLIGERLRCNLPLGIKAKIVYFNDGQEIAVAMKYLEEIKFPDPDVNANLP